MIQEQNDIYIEISGIQTGGWYTTINTKITNNSSQTVVKSIQLHSKASLISANGGTLDWNGQNATIVDGDKVTIDCDLKKSVGPGETAKLGGGLNLTGTPITEADIEMGYNGDAPPPPPPKKQGKVEYKCEVVGGNVPTNTPTVTINGMSYPLSFSNTTDITFDVGTYSASVIPFTVGTETYDPKYDKSFTITDGDTTNEVITYKVTKEDLVEIDIEVDVPDDGNGTISLSKIGDFNPSTSTINISNGTADTTDITYTKIT
jgi:hypothetical protein